ncbi:hypothetical protein AX17_003874 [Amanita inopinata Kibby_2008]|nr:hypothetical protein AX17_003874 [Amanita inopinata Kibby_2008]
MPPTRAVVFIGLNVIRILSIVTLILVLASSILVMVTNVEAVNEFEAMKGNETDFQDCDYIEGSTVPNQPAGVFWAVMASLLIIIQTIILLLSELSWPIKLFDRFFPVLGSNFGLGPLGIFQCLIATQILSHHADDFTLVAGFFLFSIGCLNILLGLVFRESAKGKRSITSWRAESKGVLPQTTDSDTTKCSVMAGKGFSPFFITRSLSGENEKSGNLQHYQSSGLKSEFGSFRSTDKAGYGFGRQGEKAAGLRGFILQTPEESLPRYASPTPGNNAHISRTHSNSSSSSSFSSPFRGSRRSAEESATRSTHSSSPSRSDRSHSRSDSSRSEVAGERSGTPVPKFKSSRMAL